MSNLTEERETDRKIQRQTAVHCKTSFCKGIVQVQYKFRSVDSSCDMLSITALIYLTINVRSSFVHCIVGCIAPKKFWLCASWHIIITFAAVLCILCTVCKCLFICLFVFCKIGLMLLTELCKN